MLFVDSCVSPDVAARIRLLLSRRDVMVCSRCCISEEGGEGRCVFGTRWGAEAEGFSQLHGLILH